MAASNWPDAIAVQGPSGGAPVGNPVTVQVVDQNTAKMILNQSLTPLPGSAGTTATRTSADILNPNGKGLALRLNIANLAGVPTFALAVDWKDNDNNYTTIWQATAVNANGTTVYLIYPGAVAGIGSSWSAISGTAVPRLFRLRLIYTGNGSTDKADTTVEIDQIL